MHDMTRRSVVGIGVAALGTRTGLAAAAGGRRTIAVDGRLVTRDIVPDTLTAGFLTDKHLGRGTVDYHYDRSTGGLDSFRVFYPDGWFDVQLALTYAPTVTSGTGKVTRGSGRFRNASGSFSKLEGTFDGALGELDLAIVGKVRLAR